MRDTLRQRLGWLHTWIGFVTGLLLCVIFAGGTLAVFNTEITRWMQPENSRLPSGLAPSPKALEAARQNLETLRAQGKQPFLSLPSVRDPVLRVLQYDGHEFVGPALDPIDGQRINVRQTVGGQLFYNLHFTLWLGRDWGRRVVDMLGLAMLVSILSGIIIHLRLLLPDLVLFRPFAARARAWLDGHILAGVFFLPFIVGITYTGVIIHAAAVLPDGAAIHRQAGPMPTALKTPQALPSLTPMLTRAEAEFGAGQIGFFLFNPHHISAVRADGASFLMTRDEAEFRYEDGAFLRHVKHIGATTVLSQGFRGFHFARWTPLPLRWLYFLSGLGGTLLIASGLVLFLMRYRRRYGNTISFCLAESLVIAVLVGFVVAALGLFWTNRLLSATLASRVMWERNIFMAIWLFSLLHAWGLVLAKRAMSAWRQQLLAVTILGMGLPILDILTRSSWTVLLGRNIFCAIDCCALVVGMSAQAIHQRLNAPHQT
ncbi:PepSY-associated TM helix domain-containing protein [Acetobacter okinawensis]|uniref:PepSY-associated TM helix domain-containing protein n=1 Tax=Acetobacter okinawensis TaxID=1076594 RepID=UPI00209CA360|nr:PepSY-associated TM helix domain-containing protein [Acetobacter okinawensis]MCP1213998.1 PepSY domain-containing protein [Acetobacter okinawensis]